MLTRLFATAACLLTAATGHAQAGAGAVQTYEANTGNTPDGISRLEITPVGAGLFAVDLRIVAPNRTHHTGHIQGLARGEGAHLVLRVANFEPDGKVYAPHPVCTLVIDADDTRANVVSEDTCAGFGGAAASFAEQGRNLLRTRGE